MITTDEYTPADFGSTLFEAMLTKIPERTPRTVYEGLQLDATSQKIRLFEVRDNRLNAPIEGKLRVVSLADSPKYAALSYVWGKERDEKNSQTPRYTIRCGKHDIEVTRNCVEALNQVRQRYGRASIWVDALCIDQSNVQERNHQVEIMGEIYSHAHTVFVWLGNATAQLTHAIRVLQVSAQKRIYLQGLPCVTSPNRLRPHVLWAFLISVAFPERALSVRRTFRQRSLRRSGKFNVNAQDSKAIQSLLSQEWFNRGWTFQELILATNPVFLCGPEALSWVDLTSAVAWICEESPAEIASPLFPLRALLQLWMAMERPSQWNGKCIRREYVINNSYQQYQREFDLVYERYTALRSLQYPVELCKAFVRWPREICHPRSIYWTTVMPMVSRHRHDENMWQELQDIQASTSVEFNGIIRALRERTVGNPKDKSYALYGIIRSMGVELHSPDYGKSKSQVYKELFLDLLRRTPDALCLLIDAGYPSIDATSPSWVPQWDRIHERGWVPDHYVYFREYGRIMPHWEGERFSMGLFTSPWMSIQANEISLSVGAETLDHVIYFVDFSQHKTVDVLSTWAFLDFITRCEQFKGGFTRNSRASRDLYNVLTMNKLQAIGGISTKLRQLDDFHDGWDDWYSIMTRELDWPTKATLKVPRRFRNLHESYLSSDVQNVLINLHNNSRAMIFHLELCKSLLNQRVLFLTEKMRVGTGQPGLQELDLISCISGVPTPLILRKANQQQQPDCFSLIGPALVSPVWDKSQHKSLPGYQRIRLV